MYDEKVQYTHEIAPATSTQVVEIIQYFINRVLFGEVMIVLKAD